MSVLIIWFDGERDVYLQKYDRDGHYEWTTEKKNAKRHDPWDLDFSNLISEMLSADWDGIKLKIDK